MSFTKNRIALAAAAASMLAVLTVVLPTDSPSSHASTARRFAAKLTAQDLAGNRGEPGEGDKLGEDPIGAEEQNYLAHAYPASELPFAATLNAQKAWKQLLGKSNKNKNTVGQWTLAGPSTANYPEVLTFSGAELHGLGPRDRVSRSTRPARCRSAGSGSRPRAAASCAPTTRSRATAPAGRSCRAASDQRDRHPDLSTNGVLYAGTGEPNASGDSEAGLGIYKSTDGGNTWTTAGGDSYGHIIDVEPGSAGGIPRQRNLHGQRLPGPGDQLDRRRPDEPEPPLRASARGVRGVSSVDGRRHLQPADPEAAVRPVQVDGRRRDVQLHLGRQTAPERHRSHPFAASTSVDARPE